MHTIPAMTTVALGITLALAGCSQAPADATNRNATAPRQQADALVAKLTLDEKLSLLSGPGYGPGAAPINLKHDVAGVAGYINGVHRPQDGIDIPAIKLADGPAGLRINASRDNDPASYYATAWPIGSLLASSWDVDLVRQVGTAIGEEMQQYGVDLLLAPGMNIQRNPLNGRNFEYYSEDPLVTGKMGAAMVSGVQSQGVGATIKHFFGNNSETNRHDIDDLGEARTFREIYLRGFQIAIDDAHPWAIMTSYNKVNGTYVNERRDALQQILRDEWHFDGLVMSDWFAGDVKTAPQRQVMAGQDLIEPGNAKPLLQEALKRGELSEAQINEAASRILAQVIKSPSYRRQTPNNQPDLTAHARLSRLAGAESMVLLRNERNALPLASNTRVASFGVNQINTYKGGTGSGDVNAAKTVNIADGLAGRFHVNQELQRYYRAFYASHKVFHEGKFGARGHYTCEEAALDATLESLISSAAQQQEVAVISIGRQAGEGADRTDSKGDYRLNDAEMQLIERVSAAFHSAGKKVVVVLNVNGVIDTSWSSKVDGVVLAYMAGQETGNALADVLSGAINPSGKLTQTFPASYASVPSSTTFPGRDENGDGKPDRIDYNEGIYVGYRYYSTFGKAVAYPFGFGLSYTRFDYGEPRVVSNRLDEQGNLILSATITNSGQVSGREAAQVYIAAPQGTLSKPAIELKAFAKTALLAPGSAEQLTFTIPASLLASFAPQRNAWIIEPGSYRAYIAPSSDIHGITPVTFTVAKELVVSHSTPGALALPAGVAAKAVTTLTP